MLLRDMELIPISYAEPSSLSTALPGVLHRMSKFLRRQGIQHVVLGEPSAPRLRDAVTQFFQVRSVVGIGVDDDFTPCCFARHSRIYTWSAIEAAGNLHKGVFASREESWRPGGAEKSFVIQAFKIDTPEALQTAVSHSDAYFNNVGKKPPPQFVLECTARFPDPVWRIYWGESVSTAEWSVFIDATTGEYKGR